MAYILDIAVILIFLAAILIGKKRGFIKTIAGVVAFVAALAVALLLGQPLANAAYDKAVEPTVISLVEDNITGDNATVGDMDDILASLPGFVQTLLGNAGIQSGADMLEKITGETVSSLPQRISDNLVRPVVVAMLRVLFTLLLFLAVYVAARILLRVLNVVAKLPLLKQMNTALGLVAGVLSGLLWVLFAVTVMQLLAATGTLISQDVLNNTLLINWLITVNPIGGVLRDAMAISG